MIMKLTARQIITSKVLHINGTNRTYSMTPEGQVYNRFTKKILKELEHSSGSGNKYVSIRIAKDKTSFKVYIDKWRNELFPKNS